MHVSFRRQENHFWQNYCILDLDNFQVRLQYWVASLCNQLLPEFLSNQFETLHRCYKHIEDLHVSFRRQENHFWQNYGILDLDNFHAWSQHIQSILETNVWNVKVKIAVILSKIYYIFVCKKKPHAHLEYAFNSCAKFQNECLKTLRGVDYTILLPLNET